MRLICPKCSAQYEVDDSAIPDAGRDVQCANCSHTWFQENLGVVAARHAENARDDGPSAPPPSNDGGSGRRQARREARANGEPRGPDEEVLDILRSEAAHEERARAGEADAASPTAPEKTDQSEIDLAEALGAPPPPPPPPERKSAGRGANERRERERRLNIAPAPGDIAEDDEDAPPPEGITAAPRRDRGGRPPAAGLPDVDDLNASLRPGAETRARKPRRADASRDRSPRAGSFRAGFLSAVLLVLLGVAAYLLEAPLAQSLPAISGPLDAYADAVDMARHGLDDALRAFFGWATGLLA